MREADPGTPGEARSRQVGRRTRVNVVENRLQAREMNVPRVDATPARCDERPVGLLEHDASQSFHEARVGAVRRLQTARQLQRRGPYQRVAEGQRRVA